MKVYYLQTVARIALTAFLLYCVYREAGTWTTITLAFLALSCEFDAYVMRKWGDVIEMHNVILKKIVERKP